MKSKHLNSILILGALAIFGIIVLQLYWMALAWQIKSREFDERLNISLRHVADQLAIQSDTKLPKEGLIEKLSPNEYIVNFNDVIKPDVLEDLLIRELDIVEPGLKFEYAVYDCFSDDLIYGNCCGVAEKTKEEILKKLPNVEKYTYYFIVRFPDKRLFLLSNIKLFVLLGLFAIIVVFAYIYAVSNLYRQKKLSELQKDFVDNMTHEFKTPLTSIKLAASVLSESQPIKNDTRLEKYSNIIAQQSDKLTTHIEKLLDLIRSDKIFNLKMEKIELGNFIRNFVKSLDHEFKDKNTEIKVEIPDQTIFVKTDKYHLNNILYNLIDNAIKYNESEVKKIEIALKDMGPYFNLSIKDNGIGINEANIKDIFKKFHRVHKDNIHDVKGFGLGLYYVKNIVKLHGWKIDVHSKPDKGSIFTIHINKEYE